MANVDIIILSWNRSDDTLRAIDSACAQQGVDVKVLVVDQGSNPQSVQKLKAHCADLPNVQIRFNEKNTGCPGGRNQASAMGTADFIVGLDNDAVFQDPYVCARAAALMDSDPDLAAIAFRINAGDTENADLNAWAYQPLEPEEAVGRNFDAHNFVGAGHMIRRSAFEQVDGYDARLFFMHEEFDLCYRFINAGYRIAYRGDLPIGHGSAAEQRILWKSGRFRYHLRNRIYIQAKTEGVSYRLFEELIVMAAGGVRSGFVWAALSGTAEAIGWLPAALAERKRNPYCKRTQAATEYIRQAANHGLIDWGPQIWDGKNPFYRLYARLRWQTDLTNLKQI
ncbi:glycosyltransferase family 2 protein [Hyphomonas sp.]|uniref:glycosyltransferase family 2 protein n=1 Tax=Hyphomonas sp. TaxID=87 RepID=UPI0035282D4E